LLEGEQERTSCRCHAPRLGANVFLARWDVAMRVSFSGRLKWSAAGMRAATHSSSA
jgi:hypothetical protein